MVNKRKQKKEDAYEDKEDFNVGQTDDEQVPEGHEGGNLGLEQGRDRGKDSKEDSAQQRWTSFPD